MEVKSFFSEREVRLMLNQIVLVGRISEIKEEDDKVNLKLNVKTKDFQDELFDVTLTGNIGKNVIQNCPDDSIVGVKGRMTHEDGNMIILAEKVTFLAPRTNDNDLER